jgi:hypothetical protein
MDFIGAAFKSILRIDEPRGPQRRAAELLAVHGASVLVVAQTGVGKSAIPLAVLALLCGVVLVIVPLFGVGADQTARTMKAARGVIAYHLDNLYGKKKREVIAKLSALKPDDPDMFVVYASPQTMRKGGGWYELFGTLVAHKTLSLVCYDEYHAGDWGRRSYRYEFMELKENIFDRLGDEPVLCMTGTLTKAIKERNARLLGLTFDHVLWCNTSRRDLQIVVQPRTNNAGMIKDAKSAVWSHLKHDGRPIAIVYSTKAGTVKNTLTPQLNEMLRSEGSTRRAVGVVGETPPLMKMLYIADMTSNDTGPLDIGAVSATSTFSCGVDAARVSIVVHFGLPMSLVDYLQEMSRAGRKPLPAGCEFAYQSIVTFSATSFTDLARRAFGPKVVCAEDRAAMLDNLLRVVSFFSIPGKCQHLLLEREFSDPSTKRCMPAPGGGGAGAAEGVEAGEPVAEIPCSTQCAFCNRFYTERKGVQRIAVVGALDVAFHAGWLGGAEVVSALWKSKNLIWGAAPEGTVFKRDSDFLFLQLVAAQMLEFRPGVLRAGATEEELPPLQFNWKMQVGDAGRMQLRSVPLKMHQLDARWAQINVLANTPAV